MRRLTLMLMLIVSTVFVNAQSKNKKFDVELIKNDTTYYWGESAVVSSEDKALEIATEKLFNDIATKCDPDAIYVCAEDQKTQLNNIIKTFSIKINEKMLQYPVVNNFEDDEYSFFVYLKKSEFREMCNARRKNIERFANRGFNSENDDNLQLEDALKSYYWGMMLCIAHPYGNNLQITVDDESQDAYIWLKDRIDAVLASFSFKLPKENAIVEKDGGYVVELNVSSNKGMDVTNLQFEYYNGQKYVPSSVNDGKAVVILNNKDIAQFNVRIEYEFKLESTENPDVNKVLQMIEHNIKFNNKRIIDIEPYVKKSVKEEDIPLGNLADADTNAEEVDGEESELDSVESAWRKIDKKFNVETTEYLTIMQEIEKALRSRDYESVRHHFTEEGFGMLDTLSRYGTITVIGTQEYSFIKFGTQVICRDINMQFDFRNNASFNRDVVFRFDDATKQVASIAFRLSSVTERDIVTKSKWPEESRLVLVNFLEDYQTAYALKRLDYLTSIYSDDALIIVGHVVKKTVIPDQAQFNLEENEVSLMKYDKNTYFKNLTRTFKSQEYINIRFADTEFTRAPTPNDREIYGVRLLQEYYSTTYGDVGYLFLLVDLTNDNPLIHVRAWQPDEVDLEKLMGIKDLRL